MGLPSLQNSESSTTNSAQNIGQLHTCVLITQTLHLPMTNSAQVISYNCTPTLGLLLLCDSGKMENDQNR